MSDAVSLDDRKAQGKPLVLVVDDDPLHRKLLSLLSERLGITYHMSSSCAEAIDALSMFSFDLILMDYRMPEVDGCSCTIKIRKFKELRGRIPIVAVTAHLMSNSKSECLAAGMDDFLAKPFTLEELNDKIQHWLQQKKENAGDT